MNSINQPSYSKTSDFKIIKKRKEPIEIGKDLVSVSKKIFLKLEKRPESEILTNKKILYDLSERRRHCAVTLQSIQMQARLHKAIRQGKRWIQSQDAFKRVNGCNNLVLELEKPQSSGTAAYFKLTKAYKNYPGIQEKLIWDIAVMMGAEQFFVPTGIVELRNKEACMGGKQEAMIWSFDGRELTKIQNGRIPLRGGIQPRQKGHLLLEKINENITHSIPQSSIVKAVIAADVFGMFDAHSKNIIVTEDKKIKFFDNTKSFPHSNRFIFWGREDRIYFSFRCSLFELFQCRKILDEEDFSEILQEIKKYRNNLEKLKDYLRTKQVQKQIEKLPKNWFNCDLVIEALEERIFSIEHALRLKQIKTLEDLPIVSNPWYKLCYALALLKNIEKVPGIVNVDCESLRVFHGYVGFYEITRQIRDLFSKGKGYDICEIKEKCEESISFKDLILFIKKLYKGKEELRLSRKESCHKVKSSIENRLIAIENILKKEKSKSTLEKIREEINQIVKSVTSLAKEFNIDTEADENFDKIKKKMLGKVSKFIQANKGHNIPSYLEDKSEDLIDLIYTNNHKKHDLLINEIKKMAKHDNKDIH